VMNMCVPVMVNHGVVARLCELREAGVIDLLPLE
jgi:hypothetical protein